MLDQLNYYNTVIRILAVNIINYHTKFIYTTFESSIVGTLYLQQNSIPDKSPCRIRLFLPWQ